MRRRTPIELIEKSLLILRKAWKGPMMIYPDCGVFTDYVWCNETDCDHYVASEIIKLSAQFPEIKIVGGCCGFGPKFIKLLRDAFPYTSAKSFFTPLTI